MAASNTYSFPSRHQRNTPPKGHSSQAKGCDLITPSISAAKTKKGFISGGSEKNSTLLSPLIIYEEMMMDEEKGLRQKRRDSLRDFDNVLPSGMTTHITRYSTSSAVSSSSSSRRGSSSSARKLDVGKTDDFLSENPLRSSKYTQSSSFGSSFEEPYSSHSRQHLYISPSVSEIVDANASSIQSARKGDIFHLNPSLNMTETASNWRSINEGTEDDEASTFEDNTDTIVTRSHHDNPLLSSLSQHQMDGSNRQLEERDIMSKVVLL